MGILCRGWVGGSSGVTRVSIRAMNFGGETGEGQADLTGPA
ncbi:hypothetical protein [Streptomyces sp. NPDC010273]